MFLVSSPNLSICAVSAVLLLFRCIMLYISAAFITFTFIVNILIAPVLISPVCLFVVFRIILLHVLLGIAIFSHRCVSCLRT